ncbi:hypothetical protein SAMN04490183_1283 [Pseudomonas corrugata]|nr:hypothetical protein SAMN04490183_1283 [Pseudomonas corrugata]
MGFSGFRTEPSYPNSKTAKLDIKNKGRNLIQGSGPFAYYFIFLLAPGSIHNLFHYATDCPSPQRRLNRFGARDAPGVTQKELPPMSALSALLNTRHGVGSMSSLIGSNA